MTGHSPRGAWAICGALLVLAVPGQAVAQAYQCRMPAHPGALTPPARPADEPRRSAAVAGYVLALSWSPEYCRTRAASRADRLQCGRSFGEFGFILHGLWPEAARGLAPQWCTPTPRPIPETVVRPMLCATPSPRLIAREWAKHGSCGFADPGAYFTTARRAFATIVPPDMERLSRGPLTHGMLIRAFVRANPGLPRDAIRLHANRRGWLESVHVCLDTRLRPRSCRDDRRSLRGDTPLRIWRGL